MEDARAGREALPPPRVDPQRLASPQTSGVSSAPDLGERGRGASGAAPPAPLLPPAWPLPSSRLCRDFPRKVSVASLRAGRPRQRTGWDPTGEIQIRCHHLLAPGSTEYSERREHLSDGSGAAAAWREKHFGQTGPRALSQAQISLFPGRPSRSRF